MKAVLSATPAACSRPTRALFSAVRPLTENSPELSCQRGRRADRVSVKLPSIPLLPPWIIGEIQRREREQQDRRPQPQLEIPLPEPFRVPQRAPSEEDGERRGVVIFQL